jgi:HEAT repeat protein
VPSFLTAGLLLSVIIAGAGLASSLLLTAVVVRVARRAGERRRALVQQRVRPLVLAVVAGEGIPPGLITVRGAPGRAAERVILSYLAQLRGDARDQLADVLYRRGTTDRLIRRSRSAGWRTRAAAADRLGLIASAAAEQRLTELVAADRSVEVRVVATRALGKTGSPAAARALLHSLGRADPVPEGIVAAALLELGPDAVAALRETLAGGRPGGERQQAMAAEVLGLLDETPAWRGLARLSAAGDLQVRASAVRALGRLGVPQAAGAVTACLARREDPALRAVAARALGMIGDPARAPALAACLDEPDYWIAHNAARALAELGPAGDRELAAAAAGRGPGAGHAREALAMAALARGEPPGAAAESVLMPAAREEPPFAADGRPVPSARAHGGSTP